MTLPTNFDAAAPAAPSPVPPAALADALGRLAADLSQQPLPPLSARALQALATRRSKRAPWQRWAAWGFSGAALCGLALIGSVLLLVLSPPDEPVSAARQVGSGFVTVATAERWQQLLREDAVASAWLVPTELPRERLAALGLPFDPARAGDRVSAELLMHPSGEVLAVRVLSP